MDPKFQDQHFPLPVFFPFHVNSSFCLFSFSVPSSRLVFKLCVCVCVCVFLIEILNGKIVLNY